MKKVSEVIEQNRLEAVDIIKAHGGRIDFVCGITLSDDGKYDWHGDEDALRKENVPYVVVSSNEYSADYLSVLSVSLDDNDNIVFLAYWYEFQVVITFSYVDFNTDNFVYEYLGEHYGNNGEKQTP